MKAGFGLGLFCSNATALSAKAALKKIYIYRFSCWYQSTAAV